MFRKPPTQRIWCYDVTCEVLVPKFGEWGGYVFPSYEIKVSCILSVACPSAVNINHLLSEHKLAVFRNNV